MIKKNFIAKFLILFLIVFSSCVNTENNANLIQEIHHQPMTTTRVENLALSSSNELYFAGHTNGNSLPLTSSIQNNSTLGFAGKMDHNGSLKWISYLMEEHNNVPIQVSVSAQDELYVFYRLFFNENDSENKEALYVAKFTNNGKKITNNKIYEVSGNLGFKKNRMGFNVLNGHIYLLIPNELSYFNDYGNGTQKSFKNQDSLINHGQYILKCIDFSGEVYWTQYVDGDNPILHLSNNNESIYIVSSTDNPELKTKNPFQLQLSGERDLFLTCISINGSLLWSSYYGGINNEHALSLSSCSNDRLYLLGATNSPILFSENGDKFDLPNENIFQLFMTSISTDGVIDALKRFEVWHYFLPYTAWNISYNNVEHHLVLSGSNLGAKLLEHESKKSNNDYLKQQYYNDVYILRYDVSDSKTIWATYLFKEKEETHDQIFMIGIKSVIFDEKNNIFLSGFIAQNDDCELHPFPNNFFSSLPSSSLTTVDCHPSFFMKINHLGYPDFFMLFGNK